MATCTLDAFAANTGFSFQRLGEKQNKAIQLLLLIKELAALGGTDYSDDLAQLQTDVAGLRALIGGNQLQAALTGIYAQNAVAAGAAVSTDVSDLTAEATCLFCLPDIDLYLLWLTCQLGEHA
jgi:hypothetical protein